MHDYTSGQNKKFNFNSILIQFGFENKFSKMTIMPLKCIEGVTSGLFKRDMKMLPTDIHLLWIYPYH